MLQISDNYDLSGSNTFRMKASCRRFISYDSIQDLASIRPADLTGPVFHIGAGSNILLTGDYPGTVLFSRIKYYDILGDNGDDMLVEVGAGATFDEFCSWAAAKHLWGAENLSGIPGQTGAAAVQNIGAYGAEVKDIIVRLQCFNLETRRLEAIPVEECAYAYRDSAFKHEPFKGKMIITGVLFRLSRSKGPNLSYKGLAQAFTQASPKSPMEVREAVLGIRGSKLPDPSVIGSAGSFFKNPLVSPEDFCRISGTEGEVPHFDLPDGSVKIPAAWLIDRCGLKGASVGGAQVWESQPLVIVNRSGSASSDDVLALEALIINTVNERFNIILHPEVEHLGPGAEVKS